MGHNSFGVWREMLTWSIRTYIPMVSCSLNENNSTIYLGIYRIMKHLQKQFTSVHLDNFLFGGEGNSDEWSELLDPYMWK
jgi:hypothetical protein